LGLIVQDRRVNLHELVLLGGLALIFAPLEHPWPARFGIDRSISRTFLGQVAHPFRAATAPIPAAEEPT
jgi:hypothetical protein